MKTGLPLIFLAIVFIIFALTYYRIVVIKDYIISREINCDPAISNCFVNDQNDNKYYKIIYKVLGKIGACNHQECEDSCLYGELGCKIVECNKDTAEEENATCSD